jgi:epoxyqueuosine reductase
MEGKLQNWAGSHGFRAALGPGALLAEARGEILERRRRGELDPVFWDRWLGWLEVQPAGNAGARSVILVAVPRPLNLVTFTLGEVKVTAALPPTYAYEVRTQDRVRALLVEAFPSFGPSLAPVRVPRKALAARLGLVRYGRNNLAYIEDFGSYFQLAAFTVDGGSAPCQVRPLPSAPIMDACETCGLCQEACPTGAIPGGRVLLQAQRCLTQFNELEGAWPALVPPGAHRCLVGCMACQEACPQNAGLPRVEDTGVVFDAEETAALLDPPGTWTGRAGVDAKLVELGLEGYRPVLGRNLRALVG